MSYNSIIYDIFRSFSHSVRLLSMICFKQHLVNHWVILGLSFKEYHSIQNSDGNQKEKHNFTVLNEYLCFQKSSGQSGQPW